MIVPVGKNKHQVNQGGMRHESFMDQDFTKLAADFSKITDPQKTPDPAAAPQEETPSVPGDLQDTMNQGGLKEQPQVDEEALGGLEGPAQSDIGGQTGPAGEGGHGGVTDEGQKVTRMVQKALGLDPSQGWAGTTTFKNSPDGMLSAITIGLTRQPGKLVQKV
jgi:hypothetical protein